ncbi:MAG TPA: amino acid ABC transporter permease [Candidatus Sulfotelmatobacter sp.]|nr:amino acid ABC transporter permease [Candidatus Sulfotelmatobacter sp.]
MPLIGFLGMNYDFQWSVLWTQGHGKWLLQGLWMTLRLSILSWIVACALGILSGALRTVPFAPLRILAVSYVEFFRNVPLLVWLFFWYFGAPQALPRAAQDWLNAHGPEFWSAVAGLSVYHGARMSEVIRAGIQSIPKTLLESSVATGLSVGQAYRMIIIPIALRLIVPPLTNESLNLLKNSSLAMTIGVAELTFATRQIETYTAKAFEALTAGTLIYLSLCLSIALIMSQVEQRYRIPGLIVRAGGAEH